MLQRVPQRVRVRGPPQLPFCTAVHRCSPWVEHLGGAVVGRAQWAGALKRAQQSSALSPLCERSGGTAVSL